MQHIHFTLLLFIFTITLVSSLNVRINSQGDSFTVPSPQIGEGDLTFASGLILKTAKSDGCSHHDYENASQTQAWITKTGFCSLQTQIRSAKKARVSYLITIWTDNGIPGLNVRAGANGVNMDGIWAFEITKNDGEKISKDCKNQECTIDITEKDANPWLEFYDSIGLIMWRLAILPGFLILCFISGWKIYQLNKTVIRQDLKSKSKMGIFPLSMVLFSSIVCICYLAVDPLRSQGIYDRPAWTVFQTMYLPATFIATFYVTVTLYQTFCKSGITELSERLNKTFTFFKYCAFVAFVMDFCLSISRGFVYDPSLGYFSAITTLYYCIAAAFIIGIYAFTVVKYLRADSEKIKNLVKRKNKIRTFLLRNLWLICLYHIFWIISAIAATAYLSSSKTYRTPTGDALVYFFAYFTVCLINSFHAMIIKVSYKPESFSQFKTSQAESSSNESSNSEKKQTISLETVHA